MPCRFLAAGFLIAAAVVVTVSARSSHPASARFARLAQQPPAQGAALQDEKELARAGERATQVACDTACHGLEFLDKRRTIREWDDAMVDMVAEGMTITGEQDVLIRRYLKRYHGVVDVNAASAADLSAVLGLSAKDAQAVVEYRTARGRFADAAALATVPDVDKSRIDAQPKALRFGGS